MNQSGDDTVHRFQDGVWRCLQQQTVQEFPLKLVVNGREFVTLTASPHELKNLVVGFLRLQGFISSREELLSLGICRDSGIAEIRLKEELPQFLKPILTSGCGTGITFNRPKTVLNKVDKNTAPESRIALEAVSALMQALSSKAEHYRQHGGIHSTAVGENDQLLIHAEDLGRHNTLDRIAGEALLKGIDLSGKILATSGRVSSEMVAKAAHLGIILIASRTSPTDLAIKMCRQWGITLIGYLRKGSMTVYACPERLTGAMPTDKL